MGNGPKIAVAEALLRASPLLEALEELSERPTILCGSIRRGLDMVGDVDVVSSTHVSISTLFKRCGNGWKHIRTPSDYIFGWRVQGYGINIDVFDVRDPILYGAAIAYATGSAEFNREVERICGENVWTRPAKTEEEFFYNSGLEYVAPEHRYDKYSVKLCQKTK